jgi:hypothetical protein
MKITEFCYKHKACRQVREWALSLGIETMEELWLRDDINPERRIWIATRPCVLTDRKLRPFACWCVRQVWHLLHDERSRNAVEVAERFANGEATTKEMRAAYAAARAAIANYAAYAATDAASAAAFIAAYAAAYAADASFITARSASYAANFAGYDADAATSAAAYAAQSEYLIKNTKPNFGGQ